MGYLTHINRSPAHNSRFVKAGVSCFYDSEVVNSSFMHLMKFRAEKPHLRQRQTVELMQNFINKFDIKNPYVDRSYNLSYKFKEHKNHHTNIVYLLETVKSINFEE